MVPINDQAKKPSAEIVKGTPNFFVPKETIPPSLARKQ
jgi:hypothetical protein